MIWALDITEALAQQKEARKYIRTAIRRSKAGTIRESSSRWITQSSAIANKIRKGEIKLSVLGDELFERAFGVNGDVVGIAIDNKIYLRRNSGTIHSDMVHEGTHAMDFLKGVPYEQISSWEGEIRAYTAEHHFQKASGLAVQFTDEEEIKVHVWSNYKRKGGK